MMKWIDRSAFPLFFILVCLSCIYRWPRPILVPYVFVFILLQILFPVFSTHEDWRSKKGLLFAVISFNLIAILGIMLIRSHLPTWSQSGDGLAVLLAFVLAIDFYGMKFIRRPNRPKQPPGASGPCFWDLG